MRPVTTTARKREHGIRFRPGYRHPEHYDEERDPATATPETVDLRPHRTPNDPRGGSLIVTVPEPSRTAPTMSIHEHLRNLQDTRHNLWHEAKAMLDNAERAHRNFTGAEEAKWTKLNAEIDRLDEQIRTQSNREGRERELTVIREADARAMSPRAIAHSSSRAHDDFASFLRGDSDLVVDLSAAAAERRKVRQGYTARDLVEDTTTAGGYLVPTDLERQLFDFLEFYTGARQLNVTVLTTASGNPLDVPKVTSHGTAALRGEGTAFAEADPAFGKVGLSAWSYGVLCQISSELMADSGVDVASFIAKDTARAIGRITDTDYTTGSGSSKPEGIFSSGGAQVGATAQTGATGVPSYGNLVDLVYSVPSPYRQSAQWFMLDTTGAKLRKIVDTTGRPIWEPNVQAGQPDLLLGHPVVYGAHVPALGTAAGTAISFGDHSGYYIRDVNGVVLESSPHYAFAQALWTWRAMLRTDGAWVDSTGVRYMKMPTT